MVYRHNIAIIGLFTSFNIETARVISDDFGLRLLDSIKFLEYNLTYELSRVIEDYGTEYFLKSEARAYRELREYNDSVIGVTATALLNSDNIRNLRESSYIILLKANELTTIRRFRQDPNNYLKEEFKNILEKIDTKYTSLADIIVDIDRLTPVGVAHRVEDELKNYIEAMEAEKA